jgi:hypothetical protein
MSGKQDVRVLAPDGALLGTISRHIRSSPWRATGHGMLVWVGGTERRAEVVGRGADARLVVRLPKGAPLPKDLVHG